MRTQIRYGETIDALSPKEAEELLRGLSNSAAASRKLVRVRAPATLVLDANGLGTVDVYTVPVGFEFEARRVFIDSGATPDPTAGISLASGGKFIEYLRSGTRIEYAAPQGPGLASQIPGIQTWGEEQGPYFRNGEIFQMRFTIPGSGGVLITGAVEGLLRLHHHN